MRALNSSVVFDETTEEGRLFHKGIVLGEKKNSSEHQCRPYILCNVNHEMPWYFLSSVLGSDIYLYQETLYLSESCKRKLRRTSPCGPPGMATQVRPTYRQRYSCYAIACRSTRLLSSALSSPFCLSFIIGMPNISCILKLRTNQCFVCNFLCVPRCKSQLALKKPQCRCCFSRNFRKCNKLTPFQVISDCKSKDFGGSNLFHSLLMQRVVEM